MAHISIQNLTVEFRIYGSSSRSLKKRLVNQATGGHIAAAADDSISVKALDNISLEINDGERIGLVGHNGAGKSTLLRTIAGIYKPTAGAIEVEGSVGTLIDPAAGMDTEATGIENIYLRGYVLGMSHREITEKIDEIAEFTELGDFLDLPVKTYSAGMFARLGFGISTSIEPSILLLDEMIGVGDASFHDRAVAKLESMIDKCRIMLVATHNKEILEKLRCRELRLTAGMVEG